MIDDEPLINLTPLVDVIFVVLIAFILIAPLIEAEKVHLAKGNEIQGIPAKNPLVIVVLQDNSILLNKKPLSIQELKDALILEKERSPDSEPLLFHDKRACFGTYQEVKSALEDAGYKNLHVVLKGS